MVNNKRNNREAKWVYLLLSIIIMVCLGTVYSWSVFRGQIEELYQIGSTQSGLPYMVSLAMYALFVFLTGKRLNKWNPAHVISMGGILIALGWVLSSFAPNIYCLTITYGIIIGSGVGITYGVPMMIIAKLFPMQKGLMVGVVLAGFGLSPLITAPLARYFILAFGLRKTFLILGLTFGALILLLAQAFRRVSYEERPGDKVSGQKTFIINKKPEDMLKMKQFRTLYLNFIIGTMIGLMLVGITSSIGVEEIQISSKHITYFVSFFAIFNGLGRPTFGWLTDRLKPKRAMLISYVLILFAAILMLQAKEGSVLIYGIAFSIFWFNLGGWLAIVPTSTLALFGEKYYTQNFGIVFTGYGIGALIGVVSSGILIDIFHSYQFIFLLIIALCSLGIISSQKSNL